MSFYPSDEYDSSELERDLALRAKRQLSRWLARHGRDDDDDPPPTPIAARRPKPLPPLIGTAAEAA